MVVWGSYKIICGTFPILKSKKLADFAVVAFIAFGIGIADAVRVAIVVAAGNPALLIMESVAVIVGCARVGAVARPTGRLGDGKRLLQPQSIAGRAVPVDGLCDGGGHRLLEGPTAAELEGELEKLGKV